MFEPSESGRVVVAAGGTRLDARCVGLARDARPHALPLAVDDATTVRCTSLRVSDAAPAVLGLDDGRSPALDDPAELDDGPYLLRLDGEAPGVCRFDGPATVRASDGGVALSFPSATRVTLGVCGDAGPLPTVTVPATPAGVARAVTHAAAAHRTLSPARSLPAFRRHPPRLAFGDPDVPESVAAATPDTGVELRVPDSLSAVLVAAPLAYYLGATLVAGDVADARLTAPAAGVDRRLDPLSEVGSAMLRRLFSLDCLLRPAAHPGLAEADLLDEVGLSPDLRVAPPAERLAAYLDAPFGAVTESLPEWHLVTYVEATPERARCLPYLLDRMSLVSRPETEPLDGRELVTRSLDAFFRGESARVDVRKPVLGRGELHGWLAPDTPIDVFDSHPAAYEHRLDYAGDADDPLRVTVVLNDPEMAGEDAAVADAYRSEDVPARVTVRRECSRRDLAAVFAAPTDLVHYIGHCETAGLRCTDGHLAAESLDDCGAETFLLNACGSYHEGRALLAKGSVAGAVTFREVLDEQAATVGTAFSRLLVAGFSIERALRLARRQIVMGKDYCVVGDGTHSLAAAGDPPPILRVERTDDDRFAVACEGVADDAPGDVFRPPPALADRDWLRGDAPEATLDRESFREFLSSVAAPVVIDDGFAWAQSLAESL